MNSLERYRQRVRDVENSPGFLVEDVKLSFAEELTRLLAEQHVSRTELAERMRTSRAYVTRILRTDYNLTVLTMVKVASALNARVSLHLRPVEAERTHWYDVLPDLHTAEESGSAGELMPAAELWADRQEFVAVTGTPGVNDVSASSAAA